MHHSRSQCRCSMLFMFMWPHVHMHMPGLGLRLGMGMELGPRLGFDRFIYSLPADSIWCCCWNWDAFHHLQAASYAAWISEPNYPCTLSVHVQHTAVQKPMTSHTQRQRERVTHTHGAHLPAPMSSGAGAGGAKRGMKCCSKNYKCSKYIAGCSRFWFAKIIWLQQPKRTCTHAYTHAHTHTCVLLQYSYWLAFAWLFSW
jgi:hypothetical protein